MKEEELRDMGFGYRARYDVIMMSSFSCPSLCGTITLHDTIAAGERELQ